MHTEHLQNVGIGRVLVGWLVAVAITSLVLLALTAFHVLPRFGEATWWSALAAALGFFGGGYFAGFRAMQAPILHGIAIALMSLLVWLVVNIVAFGVYGQDSWEGLTPLLAAAIVLVMMVAAVLGALLGYNQAVTGKPSLAEHEPL